MRHQRKAEIGYVPVIPGGGNLFFQFVNARARRCCCCNATSIRITKSTTTSSRGSPLPVDACSRQTLTPRSNIGCGKLWRKRAVAPRAKRRPLSTRPPSRFRLAASSSSRANVDRHHQMTPRALVQHRFCKFPAGWFCAATRPRRTSPAGDFFGVFFPTSTKESTTWHNA